MKKIIAALAALSIATSPLAAQTVNPVTAAQTNINAVIVANARGTITGPVLNKALNYFFPIFASMGTWNSVGVFTPNVGSAGVPGGVYPASAPTNQFMTGIVAGVPTFAQPSFLNLSGSLSSTQTPAYTGDVNSTAGSTVSTIQPGVVSNSKLAAMASLTLKANATGATATPTDVAENAWLDANYGTTQGGILCRGPSVWAPIAGSTSGNVLTANGTGLCPSYQTPGAATIFPRANVRQTVQGGPTSGGTAPSLLPATSGALSLTAQNVSTGVNALTIAAANGFNATGQADIITQLTSNPTWSGLTASTTNYLWINASTGATGSTTLQPIYQFGGTIATTSGQFTFDYQQMIGYVGNGTTAVVTPLVFVGEAVTSGSAVTSTAAYAYNGYFETNISTYPALATLYTFSANLGIAGEAYLDAFVTTAFGGYALGDRFANGAGLFTYNGTYVTPAPVTGSRLTASFSTGSSTAAFYYIGKTEGTLAAVPSGDLSFRLIQRRGWGGA